ncbi:MAG TPA: hypothetical protein VFQ44_08485 [Streptosporangiaceae bacterium]|nr:hypothetical protein [Streptosporangiaceae bacterium]
MVQTIELPALDGRSPLGFLASLGLLRVLDLAGVEPLRLSYSPASASALLHSPLVSVDEVTERLEYLLSSSSPGAVMAGSDPRFPLPAGRHADPMRRPRAEFRDLLAEMASIDERTCREWMPSLFTDLAVDAQGRADLTPFCAPSGKQNLRTFFEKSFVAVRADPALIREALTGWRRVDGFTGEYLDHRVLNSAADDPAERSVERGVPGATWLATMAIPMLRVTGDGERVQATLWYRASRRSFMIWPLCEQPLDRSAIMVLIEHPSLVPAGDGPAVSSQSWPDLGVFAVYGAERQRVPGRNFAGVLALLPIAVASG